jgi:hypothetical protein
MRTWLSLTALRSTALIALTGLGIVLYDYTGQPFTDVLAHYTMSDSR